jgi:hypothetical protein
MVILDDRFSSIVHLFCGGAGAVYDNIRRFLRFSSRSAVSRLLGVGVGVRVRVRS